MPPKCSVNGAILKITEYVVPFTTSVYVFLNLLEIGSALKPYNKR